MLPWCDAAVVHLLSGSSVPVFHASCSSLIAIPRRRDIGRNCFGSISRENSTDLASSGFRMHSSVEWFKMSVLISFVISAFLGFLSGLGVGGGSLLIIWLTLAQKMDYVMAKGVNLLFFIPPALISTIGSFVQNKLPWKLLVSATVSGCISAAAFTLLSNQWDTDILRKVFGALLLCTALREFRYKTPCVKLH